MRIIVVSDSHGSCGRLRRAILANSDSELVIHLGDGAGDIDSIRSSFSQKAFLQVRGNCDWASRLKESDEFAVEGTKIFYTHGHMQNVKYGLHTVIAAARNSNSQILLYGHTHIPHEQYSDGLYILNPGSIREGRYGIIDITAQGIVTSLRSLK